MAERPSAAFESPMLRPIAAAALAVLVVTPAQASETKKPTAAEMQSVDLSPMALPVVWRGRQVNYVFVSVSLRTAPGADVSKARAKEPYFRDALVRDASLHPFTDPNDLTRIDERALKSVLLPQAQAIAGPGVITAVVVTSQTPQRRSGLPSTKPEPPPAARAPVP